MAENDKLINVRTVNDFDADDNSRVDLSAGGMNMDLSALTGVVRVAGGHAYANATLDHVLDGTTYGRVKQTNLSNGDVDHGSIIGLSDDDHSQYHTDARAVTWLANNHETTYTHTDIALNTAHRGLVAGNPHQVTPTELSLVIGTDVQAHGDVLDDLNTLGANSADGEFLVGTDAGVLAWESGVTVRASLGLAIGTDVQAYNANLTTYAGIAPSANVQTLLGAADYAAFKTSLSLDAVENTALSTWAGTANITTLGTIGTGVWNGTSIGTGYTDAKCTATWPNTYTANQNLRTTDGPRFDGLDLTGNVLLTSESNKFIAITRNVDSAYGQSYLLRKSRGGIGTEITVNSGDELGRIEWSGWTVSGGYEDCAQIRVFVDGTPGSGDLPGRMQFYTCPDGSSTPAVRLVLDSAGNIKTDSATISDSSGNLTSANGANFSGAITNLTVVNGIVTAAS